MEKKSTLPFIILMTVGFVGLVVVQSVFFKPKIPEAGNIQNRAQKEANELSGDDPESNGTGNKSEPGTESETESGTQSESNNKPVEKRPDLPRKFLVLGSFDDEGEPLVLTLDSRGATVRRIELNDRKPNGKIKYTDVDYRAAYIGHMELVAVEDGCRVSIATEGTPAQLAGIQPSDVIRMINGEPVVSPDDFDQMMSEIKAGKEIELKVRRGGADLTLTAKTTMMPMQVIRPTDPDLLTEREKKRRGFQLTLKKQVQGTWPDLDDQMRSRNWQGQILEIDGQQVAEFTYDIATKDGEKFQVVKRYRLSNDPDKKFHLNMDFEIRNLGQNKTTVNYELCGPTGLPTEGWWYQQKIHGGTWAIGRTAGARDITMSSKGFPFKFVSGPQIVSDRTNKTRGTVLINKGDQLEQRQIKYMGVDTLYFNVALIPENPEYACFSAFGVTASKMDEVKKKRRRMTDVSYVIYSEPIELAPWDKSNPESAYRESFEIFAGPKDPTILDQYGLSDTRTFGWFALFSKPLIWLLHKLYFLTFGLSYGLAIVLLTVIVRSCMIPISRKAALNAQMMQYLAPQMKELQEKYKEEPKKFFQARSELCSKHNYKPLGGCLLMFVQLPIFLGLYRGLSVDVHLRNAPLIPGLDWCTNLAGPDKLFEWQSWNWMPSFLGGEIGFLGPYFNLLPVFAIVLMFIQQKMFMPPATDDQTATAQKMMKFMMIFMGFIFFKVAAGLCIYFVTSSVWGIIERKMLPKPELDTSKFENSATDKVVKKTTETMPLRNDKDLEERKRRDRERKRKLRQRQ